MDTILPTIQRGQYLILRANGNMKRVDEKPTLKAIYKAIGCDCIDTIMLDRERQLVMMVDDNGAITEPPKPVNENATIMYHSICRPGTTWPIRGDVALVNDEDFA